MALILAITAVGSIVGLELIPRPPTHTVTAAHTTIVLRARSRLARHQRARQFPIAGVDVDREVEDEVPAANGQRVGFGQRMLRRARTGKKSLLLSP